MEQPNITTNVDMDKATIAHVSDVSHISPVSKAQVGRERLFDRLPPHESYEGRHRWDPDMTWTADEERKVVRKTDFYLLSCLCIMFFGLQLDRGNLSNALADDLLQDLELTTNDYNNGTTIQLVCFLAAEFPVQMITKRLGFKNVLPTMMFLWGAVSWGQAWITNRASFYVTRALIGLFEGGFIPGVILFSTYFYTSKELSTRLAVFWSTLNVARVISALLAAGILKMRGIGGHTGWFWLFLLEGLLTCVIALVAFLWLPASPTETRSVICRNPWYTEREEAIMVNRILRDDPAKGLTALKEPVRWSNIKEAWMDRSMWGLYFIGLVAYIPATPVQGYLTLTLKRIGFTTFNANMLTVPSAVLQIFTMLAISFSSNYFNDRAFHVVFGDFWVMPLLVGLLTLPNGGRDWSRFTLVTLISGYPYFHPIVSSWISENSFDVKKRAITAATYNVIVQVGSLIGSQIYRADDAPYYHRGNSVLLAICVFTIVVVIIQRELLRHLNRKKDMMWRSMTVEQQAAYQNDIPARENDGNKRLDFRFSY
ncbi:Putative Major facilitator superfamily transporter [Penicillium brasilianum]|uniref:Putative Major facilitator superfamily transporter n=1 Tax=Penicillium brasilianum TaxID=104259 RepID=A0A0F7TW51_PENBI|nr:Putative Major facilitator superfamily transporter [Penicillium brasilianum]